MTGELDMGNNKIKNTAEPTSESDVSNKKYVDDKTKITRSLP